MYIFRRLFAVIALLVVAGSAEAQCLKVYPGLIVINHRVGILYGGNFYARVQCTRFAPMVLRWTGGSMCAGRTFYGRNGARSFSCRVSQIGWR